jgi:hypothetical protein
VVLNTVKPFVALDPPPLSPFIETAATAHSFACPVEPVVVGVTLVTREVKIALPVWSTGLEVLTPSSSTTHKRSTLAV